MDKCLPFGHALSCSLFQKVSDALSFITSKQTGRPNVNYLDDFLFIAALRAWCNGDVNTFMRICQTVGFPVSLDKMYWAATKLEFLGLLIDTIKQVICIPLDKVEKIKAILNNLISRPSKKLTLRELQQVCGHLNFICKCVLPGRAFTRRLYLAGAGVNNPKSSYPY